MESLRRRAGRLPALWVAGTLGACSSAPGTVLSDASGPADTPADPDTISRAAEPCTLRPVELGRGAAIGLAHAADHFGALLTGGQWQLVRISDGGEPKPAQMLGRTHLVAGGASFLLGSATSVVPVSPVDGSLGTESVVVTDPKQRLLALSDSPIAGEHGAAVYEEVRGGEDVLPEGRVFFLRIGAGGQPIGSPTFADKMSDSLAPFAFLSRAAMGWSLVVLDQGDWTSGGRRQSAVRAMDVGESGVVADAFSLALDRLDVDAFALAGPHLVGPRTPPGTRPAIVSAVDFAQPSTPIRADVAESDADHCCSAAWDGQTLVVVHARDGELRAIWFPQGGGPPIERLLLGRSGKVVNRPLAAMAAGGLAGIAWEECGDTDCSSRFAILRCP